MLNAADSSDVESTVFDVHPADLASAYQQLGPEVLAKTLITLPDGFGSRVFEHLEPHQQRQTIAIVGAKKSWPILKDFPPDDLVDLLQVVEPDVSEELSTIISTNDPALAQTLDKLSAFGPETAGGRMTTEYVSLAPDTTVAEATRKLRSFVREKNAELIYYVFVVDRENILKGVLSLRDLILADPETSLDDVMTTNIISVLPRDDQESVARTIAKYNFAALPVVNRFGRLVGVVTVDDVVDVVIEEATEDAQKMGGVLPLEESYLNTDYLTLTWKRATWLLVLFGGQLLTANVMEHNTDAMALTPSLLIFLPLIIASGGNSGAQSSSLVIRALAVGELAPRDWWKVVHRETLIGIALGSLLGIIGFARAFLVADASVALATSVSTSIVAVVLLGSLLGALLPLAIHRVGLDPAVSSTPLIASVVDVLGLMAFFALARLVFTMWPI